MICDHVIMTVTCDGCLTVCDIYDRYTIYVICYELSVKIVDGGLYFIFPFIFILLYFTFLFFTFLFLEQLGLGLIGHAVTSVTS